MRRSCGDNAAGGRLARACRAPDRSASPAIARGSWRNEVVDGGIAARIPIARGCVSDLGGAWVRPRSVAARLEPPGSSPASSPVPAVAEDDHDRPRRFPVAPARLNSAGAADPGPPDSADRGSRPLQRSLTSRSPRPRSAASAVAKANASASMPAATATLSGASRTREAPIDRRRRIATQPCGAGADTEVEARRHRLGSKGPSVPPDRVAAPRDGSAARRSGCAAAAAHRECAPPRARLAVLRGRIRPISSGL
jgi:hypothetical protein